MSTMPWGTMNDWMRLEVEDRASTNQHRLNAQATRAARRTQAAPVSQTRQPTAVGNPARSRSSQAASSQGASSQVASSQRDCTAAA
jgi:hypothetical protein